jgi:proprotein convertase subtilisin/kexin type 5
MCGAGFYLSGSICIQCATNCAMCTPAGCSNCIQGYFLTSALTCSVNCQLPCSTCSANFPTKCTSCIAGYSYSSINNQCIQQLTCNGACSVCPIGYILQLGQCIQCNVTNCQQCNTNNLQQCLSCAPGYYLNSNGCQPCQSSCATCLRGSGCTSCASGYAYNSL